MLGWLVDQIWALLQLLGFVARELEEELGTRVTVKAVTGQTVSLLLRPDWTILDVKTHLSEQLGAGPEELRIIFAGKELRDDVALDTCDLGSQSILHAVKIVRKQSSDKCHTVEVNSVEVNSLEVNSVVVNSIEANSLAGTSGEGGSEGAPSGADPLCESLVDLQLTGEERLEVKEEDLPAKRAHFYTWCADEPESSTSGLETAKLRVRCGKCGEGAILLHSDPCSWEDVLRADRILGYCESCRQEAPVVFYFRCGAHDHPPGEVVVPLYLVKSNLAGVPCLACTEPDCDPVVVFPCQAGHVICVACFRDYGLSRLGERQFVLDPDYGYTLPCPVMCEDSLVAEPRHFRLMGEEAWVRYQRFGAEELVLQSGGVLCPQPGCGAGILPDVVDCNRVACRDCEFVFCRDCLQGAHLGPCLPCEERDDPRDGEVAGVIDPSDPRASRARWTDPSSVTIRVISKPCPGCRTPTERSGGCMHMVCTKAGCGLHWCWVCQIEWTRDCMANHWFG